MSCPLLLLHSGSLSWWSPQFIQGPKNQLSFRILSLCSSGKEQMLRCKITANGAEQRRQKPHSELLEMHWLFSLTAPQLYRRRPRALRRLAVGGGGRRWGGGRRQGLRAQTQIVLTSGGGSGRAASSLYYAGHHGRERRIDTHTMGRAWGGVGVTGWMEDVRQWMSGGCWQTAVKEEEEEETGWKYRRSAANWVQCKLLYFHFHNARRLPGSFPIIAGVAKQFPRIHWRTARAGPHSVIH